MIFHCFHHLAAIESLPTLRSRWFTHRVPVTLAEFRKGVTMTAAAQYVTEHQDGSAVVGCLVAVVGPPGAGKTSVISALLQPTCLPVFRLREVVIAYSDLLADLAPSTSPAQPTLNAALDAAVSLPDATAIRRCSRWHGITKEGRSRCTCTANGNVTGQPYNSAPRTENGQL